MELNLNVQPSISGKLIYKFRTEILNGKYRAGEQFPTVRQLALELSVNPNTVQKALNILELEGLLESKGTVGRFVTEDKEKIELSRQKLLYDFMKKSVQDAKELGITKEKMIEFLK